VNGILVLLLFRPHIARPCILPLFFQQRPRATTVKIPSTRSQRSNDPIEETEEREIRPQRQRQSQSQRANVATQRQETDSQTQQESSTSTSTSTSTESSSSLRSKMPKPAKPPYFDGKDSSVSTVKAWVFSVREYVELSDIDEAKQTRYAAGYLTDTAKTWYINTYGNAAVSPDFDTFLNAFKKFYLKTSNENDAAERIETIKQEKLSVSEYAIDFKMQLSELSDETNSRWIKRYFLCGLRSKIHITIAPQVSTINDLDYLIAIT
jgi:hypothetical protein